MLNSTSPTTLVFPVEDLGGLQLQGKALHGPLEQQPIFLKAPLRGEGCAARCLLAECLWSSCRQAGRTSWSRTLQAGCGVHPLPGGRQQLAQGARRTGGRLRLTAYQHQQSRRLHITDQRERKPLDARRRRGRRKERTDRSRRTKSRYFFLKAPLRTEGCAARCLLAKCLWSS